MWVFIFVASGVVGFVHKVRKHEHEPTDQSHSALQGAISTIGSNARKAFLVSVVEIWKSSFDSFKLTAEQRAPVPLTYITALTANCGVIFGTSICKYVCVWSVGKIGIGFLKSRRPSEPSQEEHNLGRTVGNWLSFGVGILGYRFCLNKWERGTMRGTLEVFDKSPSLNMCAESERYLMEKLAVLVYGGYDKVATLHHIASRNVAGGAAQALRGYARQAGCGIVGRVLGVENVFSKFAESYLEHRADMKKVVGKLKAVEARELVPVMATLELVQLAPKEQQDMAEKWKQLRKQLRGEMGNTSLFFLTLIVGYGVVLGTEGASLMIDMGL